MDLHESLSGFNQSILNGCGYRQKLRFSIKVIHDVSDLCRESLLIVRRWHSRLIARHQLTLKIIPMRKVVPVMPQSVSSEAHCQEDRGIKSIVSAF